MSRYASAAAAAAACVIQSASVP